MTTPQTERELLHAERVAQLTAHRACHSAEHDPPNGRLHGYCIVCGVPFPCEYVGPPPERIATPHVAPAVDGGECDCVDCGGTEPGHSPGCKWMHELHGETPLADVEQRASDMELLPWLRRMRKFYINHPETVAMIDKEIALRQQPAVEGSVANTIGFYSFDPEDRFYHAKDNTWWRRADDGRLRCATPPPPVDVAALREFAKDWRMDLEASDMSVRQDYKPSQKKRLKRLEKILAQQPGVSNG